MDLGLKYGQDISNIDRILSRNCQRCLAVVHYRITSAIVAGHVCTEVDIEKSESF